MHATKSKDCLQKTFRKNRWVKKTKLTKFQKDENNMDGLAEKTKELRTKLITEAYLTEI